MLSYEEILTYSIYKQPYQQEKDYIEELFLSKLFNYCNNIVFKGGTALAKFYGSPRFSDDLDFSAILQQGEDYAKSIKGKLDKMVKKSAEEDPIKVLRTLDTVKTLAYELSIRGPLFEHSDRYQHLKIEIGKNEPVLEKAVVLRRNPIYRDLAPYVAIVMSEKEILAEKTVALLYRRNLKARDLYDIYFLVRRGVELKVSLIDRKMKWYGHAFTSERFALRMDKTAEIWDKELGRLLPKKDFISYATAKKNVVEYFEGADLL